MTFQCKLLAFTAILLCAVPASAKSDPVLNVINEELAKSCTFLTTVSGSKFLGGMKVENNIDKATKAAMKKAVERGGDSIVVKDIQLTMNGNGATVLADAYRCGPAPA